MTKPAPTIRDLLLASLVAMLLGSLVGSSPTLAQGPGPAALAPPAADAPQIEHAAYWRARGEAARGTLALARAELDAANGAVSRMRRRNHPRGAARIQLRKEQAEAQEAYDAALAVVEVELPAEARAAGAPRHWLMERSAPGRRSNPTAR